MAGKLVAISGYLTIWASLLALRQPGKLPCMGTCHQNEPWAKILKPKFFTMHSCHGEMTGLKHSIASCGWRTYPVRCGSSPWTSLGGRKSCLHTSDWSNSTDIWTCAAGESGTCSYAVCAHHVGMPMLCQRMPKLPSSCYIMQHNRACSL
jgi:hypothetical protein